MIFCVVLGYFELQFCPFALLKSFRPQKPKKPVVMPMGHDLANVFVLSHWSVTLAVRLRCVSAVSLPLLCVLIFHCNAHFIRL